MFHTITIGGKDYECRLTTKSLLKAEERLGANPLTVFMNGALPKLKDMLVLFHESLPHSINFDEACDLYDKYVSEGHNFADFVNEIMEILGESGLLSKEDGETKNA